jgi:DNA-binding response OmpR family regulator
MPRVLVVEKEPILAIMLEDAMSSFGFYVLGPVDNLKAAICLAATEQVEAALVDVNIDGQIAEGVADKSIERGILFAFVNGHTRMLNLHHSAIARLLKPFTIDDLHHTIVRLLQREADCPLQ